MLFRYMGLLSLLLFGCVKMNAADLVWVEAEAFDNSNWPGGPKGTGPFQGGEDAARSYSGGIWMNAAHKVQGLFLEVMVEIPSDGDYLFYSRSFGNWGGGTRTAFRWRFDDAKWNNVPFASGKTIEFVKPTNHSTLSWIVYPGRVSLTAGKHRFRLEVTSSDQPAAFDCFVFSRSAFVPSGKTRPGQKLGLVDAGMWSFEPDSDGFNDDSLLDLRSLNEEKSGQDGWIHLSDDGEDLLLGSGKKVRLWSGEYDGGVDLEDARRQLRFLAKRGFNAVRYFKEIAPQADGQSIADINTATRDGLWRTVAAAKENGIYVLFTPLWCQVIHVKKEWGIPEYQRWNRHRDARHVLYTNDTFRDAYKEWMRRVLKEPNPYTGIPLSEDPTLYCIQIQNEDSIFWSGLDRGLTEVGKRAMCKHFGEWLGNEYGSIQKAFSAWKSTPLRGDTTYYDDDVAKGEVGLPKSVYPLTSRWGNEGARAVGTRNADCVRFLAHLQRTVNDNLCRFLKDDLGYQGLVSANNWQTNDRSSLEDLERWTYAGCDVIATNKYVSVFHQNPSDAKRVGYQVNSGDVFVDDLPLQVPSLLPTNYKMVRGHPHSITESTWVAPRTYHAEGPLMVAAYGSLCGLDSYNWFTVGGSWANAVGKWDADIPGIQAGFPAAALMYRRGDVTEPQPVVIEARSQSGMWGREKTIIAEPTTYDPNRNGTFSVGEVNVEGGVDPLAFLVGPVRVEFDDQVSRRKLDSNLDQCIDRAGKTVGSITGQLRLDYGAGLFICDTPCTQAATGLFRQNGGDILLSDVGIRSKDEYACVIVTSMDDLPLAESGRVLIQVTTPSRPYGWRQTPINYQTTRNKLPIELAAQRIDGLGAMPWNMRRTHIALSIGNKGLRSAVQLDANGMTKGTLAVERRDDGVELTLPEDVLYVVVTH